MELIAQDLLPLLQQYGLWLVFGITLVETAIFLGLLVPAEATVLLAAFLADRGYFPLGGVFIASFLGGFIGDQIGYALGRWGGQRLAHREQGLLGRLWRRHEARTAGLFRRHALVAISLARFISFVRTLMPWFAGMTRVPYRRFVLFDGLGVFGWAAASVAVGFLAGEGWHVADEWLGTAAAVTVALLVIVAYLAASRRAARAEREGSAGMAPTPDPRPAPAPDPAAGPDATPPARREGAAR